jgi:hypothetical protein
MGSSGFVAATVVAVALVLAGCGGNDWEVVEQFDNGPMGGPRGASEGFKKVHRGDLPTPGKNWKHVDPATLTPEQRRDLGLDEVRGDNKRDRNAARLPGTT